MLAEILDSKNDTGAVVVGVSGIGKTYFIDQFAQLTKHETVIVKASESEKNWPLSGLLTVLSQFGDYSFYDPDSMVESDQSRQFPLLAETAQAALNSILKERTVLIIDDFDNMDVASQRVLGLVFRRLRGSLLKIVVSAKVNEVASSLQGFPQIHLKPLPARKIHKLLKCTSEVDIDGAISQTITRYSSGVPAVAVQMMEQLSNDQLLGIEALQLPPRPKTFCAIRQLEIIPGLDVLMWKILRFTSSAWRVRTSVLSELIPGSDEKLNELITLGIFTRKDSYVSFRRGYLRAAVYWSIDSVVRTQIHKELAASASLSEKFWHQSFSYDARLCANQLLARAAVSVSQGHVIEGVEIAERALTVYGGASDHPEIILELVEKLTNRCEFSLAARYLRLLPNTPSSAEVLVRKAGAQMTIDTYMNMSANEEALFLQADPAHITFPAATTEIAIRFALLHLDRWDLARAAESLTKAEQIITDHNLPIPEELRVAHELKDAMLTGAKTPITNDSKSPTVLVTQASASTYAERYELCDDLLRRLPDDRSGAYSILNLTACFRRFNNYLRAGNLPSAVFELKTALAISKDEVDATPQLCVRSISNYFDESEGSVRETHLALERLGNECANPMIILSNDSWFGSFLLNKQDIPEAVRVLRRCYVRANELGISLLPRVHANLIEALTAASKHAEAEVVFANLCKHHASYPSRWGEIAILRGEACLDTGDGSVGKFESAISRLTREDSSFEVAQVYSSFSRRLKSLGFSTRSNDIGRSARLQYEALGMQLWSSTLPDMELAPQLSERAIPKLLTDSEMEVALLVANGYRNKEISAELFVSVRTVELRLTGIYRKLGIKSRASLVSFLDK